MTKKIVIYHWHLERGIGEISEPNVFDVLFVEISGAAVEDERQAILLEFLVRNILKIDGEN